ncbi:MAG: sulfotransferase family protein [Micromonosporaceae bacterium]
MTLRVIGAGLARTGTASLKLALEELLGQPSYHMFEVFANPRHIPVWHQAARGNPPSWDVFFSDYAAAVDLPVSAYWQELAAVYPDALILLSVRESPEKWWESVSGTMFSPSRPLPDPGTPMAEFRAMAMDMWRMRLGVADVFDKEEMISAYQRHNDAVRAEAPKERLLEWQASDGWEPLAAALEMPVPATPFPRVNTREEFAAPEIGTRKEWTA